ncbi:hypothetical protein [Coraliomargarita sinensis]|nr:hypothetical protein [Coraliomargarita sinensis]
MEKIFIQIGTTFINPEHIAYATSTDIEEKNDAELVLHMSGMPKAVRLTGSHAQAIYGELNAMTQIELTPKD